jgi:hypothetical protein
MRFTIPFLLQGCLTVVLWFKVGACNQPADSAIVLPAHAHNDYRHKRPLYDALDCKFQSIEADVFSVGDSLFVAHDVHEIVQGRTLRNLYLDPIREVIQNNNGSVYGEGSPLILFIDIKDDGLHTYRQLHAILTGYTEMLTRYENGVAISGAVSVIISGNRPFEYMRDQQVRFAGFDGRIRDLDSGLPSSFMPVVSDNWNMLFQWRGEGGISAEERQKLNMIIEKAHKHGYMLRFWSTPDRPGSGREAVWSLLRESGVDLIGTDDLNGLREWLDRTDIR